MWRIEIARWNGELVLRAMVEAIGPAEAAKRGYARYMGCAESFVTLMSEGFTRFRNLRSGIMVNVEAV